MLDKFGDMERIYRYGRIGPKSILCLLLELVNVISTQLYFFEFCLSHLMLYVLDDSE